MSATCAARSIPRRVQAAAPLPVAKEPGSGAKLAFVKCAPVPPGILQGEKLEAAATLSSDPKLCEQLAPPRR
eukprot:CAMPEP_0175964530 /NCGR_PEP_ID=MMETSP0108-20121206/37604_1 /TAXON_ID=195067 ORGANISM="Goniomonas pacifica, Strain CCMP1869" /NCGR_SAMPLE_ID=MMETSP0108 /ASSEMBLY_ACC=CAM_ASM_000204 /LENGTH=71 /DNA_ID=CAMNT_0017292505 /DNA_START=108 /DNA_END=320 /DNA_ORIENTATION=+